ncbi:MAG: hypothetical protein GXX99_04135 [Clostridiales bacterium]|nr:hypothetical protein [Clostridiales bacterium]
MSEVKKSERTDFLMISGRTKSREVMLIDTATADKLIEASDMVEVLKLLGEHGYDVGGLAGDEKNLAARLIEKDRAETAELISQAGKGMFDCFLYPHDYHNLKVALKNELLPEPLELFVHGGSIPVEELREAVKNRELGPLTPSMQVGVQEALEAYSKTGNSQLIDLTLDRYCFRDMTASAKQVGNDFLEGYVRTKVDVANVKALLRMRKMGKSPEFAAQVFFDGGNVPAERYAEAYTASEEELPGLLVGVAALLQKALAELNGGGGMSAFELYCDDHLMAYVRKVKYVQYGAEVPMAYLLAKETEYIVISMILAGRQTGLSAAQIKERLRALYV